MPRILKREAKALKDSDVGKVRLVYGTIQNILFTGIGEVQICANGDYELYIYQGQVFKLQNISLQSLAAYYSSGLAD